MSTNLNSIDSSIISNIVSTYKASTETSSKDIESPLFATQLDNSKKTDSYLNEIKNCVPKTTVTVKSMNAGDIQKYYEEWKKLELIYSHRRIYDQRQLQTLSEEVIKSTQFMGPQYYFYAAAASKMRKGNQAIDLE